MFCLTYPTLDIIIGSMQKEADDIDIQDIRANIPILKDVISFNSGMDGPLPTTTIKAINDSFNKQYTLGPFTQAGIKTFYDEILETKNKLASFLLCNPENISLTPNTTFGINIALNAFNWTSEDEIISTRHEHPGALFPLYNLKERYSTKIKLIDIDTHNSLKSIRENLSQNTKAIVLSHIFYETGNTIHNLQEVLNMLREKNIISIIDGAQAVGAIKVNLKELNPDFYAAPGHKWSSGPYGTGFLYVNEILFSKRPPWPSIVGFNSALFSNKDRLYDFNFKWRPNENASLFEFGGLNSSIFKGLGASIDFITSSLKQFNIYNRIHQLTAYLIERLNQNPNIIVHTSKNHAGLVSWQHKNIHAHALVNKLWEEKKIAIREIQGLNLSRASIHFFNTKEEIDFLLSQLP